MNPSTNSLEILSDAAASLQAGHAGRARELLHGLILAQPGNAEAHRQLAMVLLQAGEAVRAQKELRICLRLRPDDTDAQVLLARALSATGQTDEAARVLQATLQRDPVNVAAVCALARLWLTQSRAQDALRVLQPLARSRPATAEFLMLYGHASMLSGRAGEAVAAFRQWLEQEPDNSDAGLRLAGALADSGEAVEAETVVRAAIRNRQASSPDAAFILGRALLGQGRFEAAEAELRNVVQARPEHVVAQNNLAELVWMRTGDADAACAAIDAALRRQPRLHALRIARARLLSSARRATDALAEVQTGLAFDARDPALLKAAATIALDFDGARALEYSRQALEVAPQDRGVQVAFGNASLAVGDARQALDVARRLHASDPADGQALAMLGDALRMSGDARYRELLDYGRLVRADFIDVPPEWPGLAAYLADLRAALERAHTLSAHPIGNSLRQGSQIELQPARSPDAAIRAFPQAIDGAIRACLRALGGGDDPLRRRNTGGYRISGMWSVRLRPHGFHVNHYHPEGWLSSAFYLQLPPAMESRGGEGWLKFGEPAFPTLPGLGPEYFLKPEPGLLALFPAYMWHGTVPFSGGADDSRLTIAFDVVPA
jgi:predicted Zn-dependent protease